VFSIISFENRTASYIIWKSTVEIAEVEYLSDVSKIQLTIHMCEQIAVGNCEQQLSDEIRNVFVPSAVGMRNLESATGLFA
jgi:hypothetical protein